MNIPAQPPTRIVGRYALYGIIAAGGMATVHFGRLLGPVGFSRTVAIKRLHPQFAADPEFVSMFLDEARLAARIRHPNVVPTLDVVATNGELFLVMDYVPGESLGRLLRAARDGHFRIPPSVVVAIMVGVLHGLHAAHEAKNEHGEPLGIVHRDVSPQNILVGSDGQARVLDFGVARATGRMQTTREGQLKGKLAYMAPEQLRDEALSRRTDIYAASVVLWEALTGQRLFAGDNEGAVITSVLEGSVSAPSKALPWTDRIGISMVERIDPVVLVGLHRDPRKRFATAREMALALEKTISSATASEVGEYIEQIARDVLIARAGLVAEIESSSVSMQRPIQNSSLNGADNESASIGTPSIGHTNRIWPHAKEPRLPVDGEIITQASTISRSVPVAKALRQRRRNVMVLGVGAALGIALVPFLLFLFPRRHEGVTLRTVTTDAPLVSAARSTEESVSTLSIPEATVAATPSASTGPSEGMPTGAPTTHPILTGRPHPVVRRPSIPKPPDTPVPDCTPPFTYDAEGKKHYKPDCI